MSLGTGLVDRTARFVAERIDRRDLFRRAAMAGTAMAVAPATFALTRTSAYATVCACSNQLCECGATCCDGYTEFCCTITGRNACPSGTFLAGWWKVDGSNFCGGGARYYLDCNTTCGSCGCGSNGLCAGSCSGTPCSCGRGDCGNRKSGCTRFRYGQCHNEMACLGPIVCRVVSCVPPWQLDATCSTAALVDNGTRFHNVSCLQGEPFGNLESVTPVQGGYRITGWVADPDAGGPIEVHAYANGAGTNFGVTHINRPDVTAVYPGLTWPTGFDRVVTSVGPGPAANICVYGINVGAGGNRLLACRSVNADPIRSIDRIERVPGGVRIQGWAVDLDQLSPVEIHIYLNGVGSGATIADIPRPDVQAFLGLPTDRWGFDKVFPWAGSGSLDVCVYAINKGVGSNNLVGCATFANAGSPIGVVDLVQQVPGGLRVAGWAWDPDGAPPSIRATVGGSTFSLGTTNQPRPDVAAHYPGAPQNCGFDGVIPFVPAAGRADVCVEALDPQGGAPRALGCRSVLVTHDPTGNVDSLTRSGSSISVAGWALDPDTAGPVNVQVFTNGTLHDLGPATGSRPDVANAYPGYGPNHGFSTSIPVPATGAVTVEVHSIGTGPGLGSTLIGRTTFPGMT